MRGYILDLDNTLYDENQYLRWVFLDFWKKHGLDESSFEHICSQALSDESRLHSKDIFKTFLELAPIGYTQEHHNELFDLYANIDCEIELYQDAKDFLQYLEQNNYPAAILTNGPVQAQKNKIKNLKLSHMLVFYARENGIKYEKPHPNAFQKVLDYFALQAKDCHMIGDNPNTDLYGASQIGITPVWLQRGYAKNMQNTTQCIAISNFNQLKEPNCPDINYLHISQKKELLPFQQKIAHLFCSCFERKFDSKLWEWLYLNNPFGDPLISLAFMDGVLVGHYAFIPIATTQHRTLLSVTTAVLKAARKHNIFFDLAKRAYQFAKQMHYDFIVGFPNKKSAQVHEKLLDWTIYPTFVSQCYFKDFKKLSFPTTKDKSCSLDLSNSNFLNWRTSKPNATYHHKGQNFYKFYGDDIDILTLRNDYQLLDFKSNFRINFLTMSKDLEKYKCFDYPFAVKNLHSSKTPNFYPELLMSDVF